MADVKERSLPTPPRTRQTMKTTERITGATTRATTAKIAKQQFSSGENIVESEGKQQKAEEDSQIVRGNSLVRKGRRYNM